MQAARGWRRTWTRTRDRVLPLPASVLPTPDGPRASCFCFPPLPLRASCFCFRPLRAAGRASCFMLPGGSGSTEHGASEARLVTPSHGPSPAPPGPGDTHDTLPNAPPERTALGGHALRLPSDPQALVGPGALNTPPPSSGHRTGALTRTHTRHRRWRERWPAPVAPAAGSASPWASMYRCTIAT